MVVVFAAFASERVIELEELRANAEQALDVSFTVSMESWAEIEALYARSGIRPNLMLEVGEARRQLTLQEPTGVLSLGLPMGPIPEARILLVAPDRTFTALSYRGEVRPWFPLVVGPPTEAVTVPITVGTTVSRDVVDAVEEGAELADRAADAMAELRRRKEAKGSLDLDDPVTRSCSRLVKGYKRVTCVELARSRQEGAIEMASCARLEEGEDRRLCYNWIAVKPPPAGRALHACMEAFGTKKGFTKCAQRMQRSLLPQGAAVVDLCLSQFDDPKAERSCVDQLRSIPDEEAVAICSIQSKDKKRLACLVRG